MKQSRLPKITLRAIIAYLHNLMFAVFSLELIGIFALSKRINDYRQS